MMYAVVFEDDDNLAHMRSAHMSDHLAFLERNAASIESAGPLKDARNASPAGGLWIVDAENAQAVQALVEEDPFWPTGLRKAVRILEWTQVFNSGGRQIAAQSPGD